MSEFIYKEYLPANARVIIDYKAREKVKFSYPRNMPYWKAVWKNAYPTVASFWIHLHVSIAFYIGVYIFLPAYILKSIFFPTIVEATSGYTIGFIYLLSTLILPLIGTFAYLFGIPAIFTYYLARDKERLSSWIPKIGYWSANLEFHTKYKIFTKKDVVDNKVIIPVFSNIYLNYECEGDFDRYLERVEIMEIPFNYQIRNFFIPFLKKKRYNDTQFRAVFHFSRPVNNGNMRVTFA